MSLGATATEDDGELIARLFGAIGKIWKADEKLFDAITGLRYLISHDLRISLVLFTPKKYYLAYCVLLHCWNANRLVQETETIKRYIRCPKLIYRRVCSYFCMEINIQLIDYHVSSY